MFFVCVFGIEVEGWMIWECDFFAKCSKELKQPFFLWKHMFQSGYMQFFATAMEANVYPLRFGDETYSPLLDR